MIPTRIGQQCNGGTFSGFNRIRDRVYAIIVAPKSVETAMQIKTDFTGTPNTQSLIDGFANTAAMNTSSHPAANYCINLRLGRHDGWYLPSLCELWMIYRFLKPCTADNAVPDDSYYNESKRLSMCTTPSSIPVNDSFTYTDPTQTTVIQFSDRGNESFKTEFEYSDGYWSSTEFPDEDYSTVYSATVHFLYGQFSSPPNVCTYNVRPVRRVQVV